MGTGDKSCPKTAANQRRLYRTSSSHPLRNNPTNPHRHNRLKNRLFLHLRLCRLPHRRRDHDLRLGEQIKKSLSAATSDGSAAAIYVTDTVVNEQIRHHGVEAVGGGDLSGAEVLGAADGEVACPGAELEDAFTEQAQGGDAGGGAQKVAELEGGFQGANAGGASADEEGAGFEDGNDGGISRITYSGVRAADMHLTQRWRPRQNVPAALLAFLEFKGLDCSVRFDFVNS
ncbi:hypothetical protein V496_00443 [Pseudogymnoascus sp. VKM F-4515 (FW-2607)]|nr:hypothetical protein V496_00443 [Pseudogymnoascus sp. VKM F-4515 (FW-2607)]